MVWDSERLMTKPAAGKAPSCEIFIERLPSLASNTLATNWTKPEAVTCHHATETRLPGSSLHQVYSRNMFHDDVTTLGASRDLRNTSKELPQLVLPPPICSEFRICWGGNLVRLTVSGNLVRLLIKRFGPRLSRRCCSFDGLGL